MQDALAALLDKDTAQGAVVARVVAIEGFSTRPGDDLVAIDATGAVHGSLLGGLGAGEVAGAAASLRPADGGSKRVVLDIGDREAVNAGLACGGRAEILLQRAAHIPAELWQLLSSRSPAALVTPAPEDGAAQGPASVVDRAGRAYGGPVEDAVLSEALSMLESGRTDRRQVEQAGTRILVEAWVPEPRLVVVGGGELVAAIAAQAGLLGWETADTGDGGELGDLLDWAGGTGALVVLSHDPHVDSPSLAEGLRRGVPYVGALGSRSTQARRTERLLASGVDQADIDRIHRPIGLDLGGRRAPEVALAIVAEVLASHCGRDARPLSQRDGPIH